MDAGGEFPDEPSHDTPGHTEPVPDHARSAPVPLPKDTGPQGDFPSDRTPSKREDPTAAVPVGGERAPDSARDDEEVSWPSPAASPACPDVKDGGSATDRPDAHHRAPDAHSDTLPRLPSDTGMPTPTPTSPAASELSLADPHAPTDAPPPRPPSAAPSSTFGVPRVRRAWGADADAEPALPVLGALDVFDEGAPAAPVLVPPAPYAPYTPHVPASPRYEDADRWGGRGSDYGRMAKRGCCSCVVM